MHGGTIVAESSEEDGTVFSARLPRAQAEARA
jgi:signal transduction histidine kinase